MVIGSIIIAVVSAVYSHVASSSAKRKAAAAAKRARGTLVQRASSNEPRRLIYGRARVGGLSVGMAATGTDNEYFHWVLYWCEGPIEAVEKIYFDDKEVTLDGSGNATGEYAGLVTIKHALGALDQAAIAEAVSGMGGEWTTNDHLYGCAHSWIRVKYDETKFRSGMPNISALIKGFNNVYNPVTQATGWSENPACCENHYLVDLPLLGPELTDAEMNQDALENAVNVSDEDVAVKAGGTEKRYVFNGVLTLDQDGESITDQFSQAMAGFKPYIGGQWHIVPGAYITPTFTITPDIIVGPISFSSRKGKRDRFNVVRGTYQGAATNYQPTDFPAVPDNQGIIDDKEELSDDIDLLDSATASRCQRIAKIYLKRSRAGRRMTVPCNVEALRALPGANVLLNFPEIGFTNAPMAVYGWSLSIHEGKIEIRLELQATSSTDYAWDESEEETPVSYPGAPDLGHPPRLVGSYYDFIFKWSETKPETPTGDAPAGWSDVPPTDPEDGSLLWMSKAERDLRDSSVIGTWSEPASLSGPAGVDGTNGAAGDSIYVQYSSDNATWHDPPFVGGTDVYMRTKTGVSGTWTTGFRIVSENPVSGFLTNDTHAVPAEADGSSPVLTGAVTDMLVFIGTTEDTSNWSYGAAPSSGMSGSFGSGATKNRYTVSGMTVDTGYIDITASKSGLPSITKRFSLAKAKKGSAGANGSNGSNGADAQFVVVTGEQVFKYATVGGTPTPTSITLTAALFGGLTAYDWEYWNGSAWTNLSGTQNASTYSLEHNNAAWSGSSLRVRCLSGTLFDEITVIKVTDGANGSNGSNGTDGTPADSAYLTNESQSVPANADGSNPVLTNAITDMVVYVGATNDTANWTFARTDGAGVTSSMGSGGTANRCTVSAMTTDTGYVDITASKSGHSNIVKRFLLAKAKKGTDGSNGSNGADAQYVVVSAPQMFKYAAGASTPTPTSITLSAQLFGGLTTYDWEYWNGSAWTNLSGTQNAQTYDLAYNNAAWGSAEVLRVRCLSGSLFDEITIVKLYDGANGSNGSNGSNGADATAYWLICDVAAVHQSSSIFTPASINATGKSRTGTGNVSDYSGRFVISTFAGSTWTDRYTSSSDEATKAYTLPTATYNLVRVRLYAAGGTSTLLDEKIVPIVSDGTSVDQCPQPAFSFGTYPSVTIGAPVGSPSDWRIWYNIDGGALNSFTSGAVEVSVYNEEVLVAWMTAPGKIQGENQTYVGNDGT